MNESERSAWSRWKKYFWKCRRLSGHGDRDDGSTAGRMDRSATATTVPSTGVSGADTWLLGFRQPFLTVTRGTGIFHALFNDFEPYYGEIRLARTGSLVALETGAVTSYALRELQQRGAFFVEPGDEVYTGQVVGEHIRDDDLVVNVCKTKQLGNYRRQAEAGYGRSGCAAYSFVWTMRLNISAMMNCWRLRHRRCVFARKSCATKTRMRAAKRRR